MALSTSGKALAPFSSRFPRRATAHHQQPRQQTRGDKRSFLRQRWNSDLKKIIAAVAGWREEVIGGRRQERYMYVATLLVPVDGNCGCLSEFKAFAVKKAHAASSSGNSHQNGITTKAAHHLAGWRLVNASFSFCFFRKMKIEPFREARPSVRRKVSVLGTPFLTRAMR